MNQKAEHITWVGSNQYKRSERIPIEVPEITRMSGRPRQHKRVKDPHESPSKPEHITRHGRIVRCSVCKQVGHNAKTYKQPRLSGDGASSSNASRSTSNAPRKRSQQGPPTSNEPPTKSLNSAEGSIIPTQSSQTVQSGMPLNNRRHLLLGMSSTNIGSSTSRQQPFTIPR
ncbi:PREDICTED: uncharacterized protein LOC104822945 [Tarenaya hassleriana]|uniref:uncharacterized protein LOC104822945 n=1 Tax=Tarenaya hassleriana TaxID=28532 RepID=UPI00053C5A26|nr:PREDICTED: uncharacterized protein LOC104822945 [Tarenaya hassleriana]